MTFWCERDAWAGHFFTGGSGQNRVGALSGPAAAQGSIEVEGSADEGEVGERLREIPQRLALISAAFNLDRALGASHGS